MGKKNRSKSKRRSNKPAATSAAKQLDPDHTDQHFSNDDYFQLSRRPLNRNLYLDRRNDLQQNRGILSGSVSSRVSHGRRNENQKPPLPLTDRNLQTLLEQSATNGSNTRYGTVALDMDQYARQQQQLSGGYGGNNNNDGFSIYSHDSAQLLLEFGELNPSLHHLSDLTSLDDVCFPDYYEGLMDADSTEIEHVWPDLSVLEEFVLDELDDLLAETAHDDQEVNFHFPVARRVSTNSGYAARNATQLDEVLPTNEEAPLLLLVHVDERTLMKLSTLSFRVRPKPIQPWEKGEENVTFVNHKGQPKKDALCRFTYFREDIEGTIHAPTLLGLVGDSKEANTEDANAISTRLKQLFSPSFYRKEHPPLTREETPVPESDQNGVNSPTTATKATGLLVANTIMRTQSHKLSLPMPGATLPSTTGTAPATTANSINVSPHHHTPPFWLDILDPLEEEMKVLSKTFGLHPLTTEDIFLGETREKVELFRQYYFICFTSFDIVYERRKQRAKEHEKKLSKLLEYSKSDDDFFTIDQGAGWWKSVKRMFQNKSDYSRSFGRKSTGLSALSKNKRVRSGELCPLNMYMIIFKHGVLTFHFSATPHPINVRRRARMLKDHLTVSTDWICYALIDDITDSFAPMIDSIEAEVYMIEDEIMKMHSGDTDESSSESEDLDLEDEPMRQPLKRHATSDVFYRRQRSKSIVEAPAPQQFLRRKRGSRAFSVGSRHSLTTRLSSSKSTLSKIVAWKRKGDMLRRIGECRKRVMSVMRLLGSKADVIKGFSKRFNENESISHADIPAHNARLALRQEILMYLGDIQDHIVTMVQLLNHYEKLLARCHSNYLAQINIDMTKVNNDMNDVLGKITILGTIVLPINVVTGLWGMNCIVPGQDHEGLVWFYGILVGISMFSVISYIYAKKVTGL